MWETLNLQYYIKTGKVGAREMAQLLRTPVLAEGLIPSTHEVTQLSTAPVPGDPVPPSELCRQT